ncbi:MAG: hypothetical protein P8Y70_01570 [Candidatus Lokiarchaeota archaeon]
MTIVFIVGNVGSGKTFLMLLIALSQNKRFYSNFSIYDGNNHTPLPNRKDLKMNDFLTIKDDYDVFIDEAYFMLESRLSNSNINVLLTNIINLRRKTKSVWYINGTYESIIDVRVRDKANIVIKCLTRLDLDNDDFNYLISWNDYDIYDIPFHIRYNDAKQYFKYYNTYELVKNPRQSQLEYDIISKDTNLLYEKTEQLVKEMNQSNEVNVITHDSISYWLLKHKYDTRYQKFMYMKLNNQVDFKQ